MAWSSPPTNLPQRLAENHRRRHGDVERTQARPYRDGHGEVRRPWTSSGRRPFSPTMKMSPGR